MAIKVGINGFGRIGRMVFRAAAEHFPDIEIVGINDLLEPDYLAYMLQYDSVHGRFDGDVAVDGNTLVVNGKRIRLSAERDPAALKWGDIGVDVVVEATGLFLDDAGARKHLAASRWRNCIMSEPATVHASPRLRISTAAATLAHSLRSAAVGVASNWYSFIRHR